MRNITKLIACLSILFFGFSLSTEAACKYGKELVGDEFAMGVRLEWSTLEEEDSSMFVVEKSEDGVEFSAIGNVVATGDSEDMVEYSFLDIMASGAKIYYRLKQVDLDGASSYSRVYEIEKELENNIMVVSMSSLNASDYIDVTLDALKEGVAQYFVKNLKGEVMLQNEVVLTNGLNDIKVDLTSLKPANYKVVFSMGQENEELVINRVEDEIRKKSNFASKNK